MSISVMSLVWDTNLPPQEKLVLLAYADRADDEGENIFPAVPTIARKTGYTDRNVQLILRKLIKAGIMVKIGINPNYNYTNIYRIDLDVLKALARGEKIGGENISPVKKTAENVSNFSPYTSFNTSINDAPKNGASRKPETPRKPKQEKPRDPLLDHPAVVAYKDVAHLSVPETLRHEVAQTVTEDELHLWRSIIADWIGYGWNPRNIKGMLEAYRAGGIKLKKNGNGSQPAPYEYPQEDDWQPGQKFNFTKNAVKT